MGHNYTGEEHHRVWNVQTNKIQQLVARNKELRRERMTLKLALAATWLLVMSVLFIWLVVS